MSNRITTDDRLDHLYMKSIRCPYCHTKIEKGMDKCATCGISKFQIYHATLAKREHRKGQVIYTKVRPATTPYWKMALGGMFGFLGIHCFVAKRWWRGALMLACTLLFLIFYIIFPNAYGDVERHWLRAAFEDKTYLFPTDLFGIVAFVWWVVDWIAILFGQFKYPVVLNITDEELLKEDAPQA